MMENLSPAIEALLNTVEAKHKKSEGSVLDPNMKALTALAQIGLEQATRQQLLDLVVEFIQFELDDHRSLLDVHYDRLAADSVERGSFG